LDEALQQRVIEVISRSQKVELEQITLETTFQDLGMTSLDALALIFDLEEEFNISIPNEQAMGIRTVREAVDSVTKLLGEG
jgi:acyl carrier protein